MDTLKNVKLVNNFISNNVIKLLDKESLNKVLELCMSYDTLHTKIILDRLQENNELDINTLFSTMLFTCIKLSKK